MCFSINNNNISGNDSNSEVVENRNKIEIDNIEMSETTRLKRESVEDVSN